MYPAQGQTMSNAMQNDSCEASRPMTSEEIVAQLFTYHPPMPGQVPKYDTIRDAAKYFASVILKNTPRGADQSAALRKLRECVMTANAAIALDGLSL